MRKYLARYVPDLDGEFLYAKTCMYTNTPDEHFVISTHPEYPQVAVESDDDDMMMTWLGIALRDYANAMANWLLDASRESGKPLTLRASDVQ